MEPDFWHQRWEQGQTGFHQPRATPLLAKFWPSLGLTPGSRVLVPLCGKSIDMCWLAEQGHEVIGIELSPIAVTQFFQEHGLTPTVTHSGAGDTYTAGAITLICGDIFYSDPALLASCQGVYDRAALVALPAAMRRRYVDFVYGQLAPGFQGLLLTLDYDQALMDGPPFAVNNAQVQCLFGAHCTAKLLDERSILDKEPKFQERGLTRLDTLSFHLNGS
jgi:thiopurine S-methyltransferase